MAPSLCIIYKPVHNRRSHLASLLKEHCLVEGGDSNVKQWLKDEGLDASVAAALKVCLQAEMLHSGSLHEHDLFSSERDIRQDVPPAEINFIMRLRCPLA